MIYNGENKIKDIKNGSTDMVKCYVGSTLAFWKVNKSVEPEPEPEPEKEYTYITYPEFTFYRGTYSVSQTTPTLTAYMSMARGVVTFDCVRSTDASVHMNQFGFDPSSNLFRLYAMNPTAGVEADYKFYGYLLDGAKLEGVYAPNGDATLTVGGKTYTITSTPQDIILDITDTPDYNYIRFELNPVGSSMVYVEGKLLYALTN